MKTKTKVYIDDGPIVQRENCLEKAGKKEDLKLQIISAGVDSDVNHPPHQTERCDDCGKMLGGEAIQTCSDTQYLSLCEACYQKIGNSVR